MNLNSSVSKLPLVGPIYLSRLEKLNISTVEDLLLHIPSKYLNYKDTKRVKKLKEGDLVKIRASLVSIKNQYTRRGKKIQFAQFEDVSGKIMAIWFNQPFLIRNLKREGEYNLYGKVGFFGRKLALISPEYEDAKKQKGKTSNLIPVYPETAGISSKWLRARIAFSYNATESKLDEFLPDNILKKFNLSNYKKSIKNVHFPKTIDEAEKAKKRLAFNELLINHLKNEYRKSKRKEQKPVHKLKVSKKDYKKFTDSLPFELTASQKKAIKEILTDLEKNFPMNRLLQGDVGSGKTVVAAAAAFVSFLNECQSVFMAPTQILANQHYKTLNEIFSKFKVRISLITSDETLENPGKTDVFVGTHALIHKKVDFNDVALVVIDEQHRFGVEQRAHLTKKVGNKTFSPHTLTMSATPIPRTVALTLFSELDLSSLRELPKGRQPITTWIVPPKKRKEAYNWVGETIKNKKNQAYVICPLIEESEAEGMQQVKAATKEYENLKEKFPKLKIGLLHGAQESKKKKKALSDFKDKKIDILVSTPVVEVGIDVPNATIMVIEGAERFGLAQLHQLRGRVGRGKDKSFCLLFTKSRTGSVKERLEALRSTKSGFELAELDLKMRGPGEIFGLKQHGFIDLKIADWKDTKLLEQTKSVAKQAIKNPNKYSKLLEKLSPKSIIMN